MANFGTVSAVGAMKKKPRDDSHINATLRSHYTTTLAISVF